MALTPSTNPAPTEPWRLLLPATFPVRESSPQVGSMLREASGSSPETVSTRLAITASSTTCGSIVPANGRGWVGLTYSASREPTELPGQALLATSPGHATAWFDGLMHPEISGSLAAAATTQTEPWGDLTICGSTAAANGH